MKNQFNNKFLKNIILCFILCFGLLDQISDYFIPNSDNIKKVWNNEDKFVSEIEKNEPKGAMIYQLPYITYPEGMPFWGSQAYYSHALVFLHSDNLKLSFGNYNGRIGDEWYKYISKLTFSEQIEQVALNGFCGVYVNKQLYEKESEFDLTIEAIKNITGVQPIISDDNNLYYFTLKNYKAISMQSTKKRLNIFHKFLDGFYDEERNGDKIWHWCSGSGEIAVYNISGSKQKINMSMYIDVTSEGEHNLDISCNNQKQSFKLTKKQSNYVEVEFVLNNGENIIYFNSNIPSINVGNDNRNLAFSLVNIKY